MKYVNVDAMNEAEKEGVACILGLGTAHGREAG